MAQPRPSVIAALKTAPRRTGHASLELDARLAGLRKRMTELKLDAYLLTHAPDIAHVTGFAGHDSAALITHRGVTVITDSRYTEELATEAPHVKLALRKTSMAETVAPLLGKIAGGKVGFESHFASFGLIDGIRRQLRSNGTAGVALAPLADVMVNLRKNKDAGEHAAIRKAVAVAEAAFRACLPKIKPGMTEGHLAGRLILEMRARGATNAAFDPIVGAGPHSSLPHYRPDASPIRMDQPLLVDWGALVDHYRSDLTRTMFLGKVHPKLEKIYKVVLEANEATIAGLKPGLSCKTADAIARNIIKRAGFDKQFGHGLGHGIGRDIHEEPRLHKSRDKHELEPGQIVTVEPGIYLPGLGGVRIEDDVLITETGCEVLSTLDKSFEWARTVIRS